MKVAVEILMVVKGVVVEILVMVVVVVAVKVAVASRAQPSPDRPAHRGGLSPWEVAVSHGEG